MEATSLDTLVRQLSAGFDALQDEYQKLYSQHQSLERKLATAREQYNELAKRYGSNQTNTPPLSLSSTPSLQRLEHASPAFASEILVNNADPLSREAATIVKAAEAATKALHLGLPPRPTSPSHGVRIWSGPSADRQDTAGSSMMPSISESPLEQDFTVAGTPSRLGCPFASMAKKKLSSHAASVLSRYNQSGSVCAVSTQASSSSRVNGRGSSAQRNGHRRESFPDPIKAEICGLSDHEDRPQDDMPVLVKKPSTNVENADAGVCPIRFLDQHSPEEVATYFNNHKHELPRSHEVCVKRYQSNEEQIRQLDAKYGNLVSMIQGLGKKHQDYLPEEPQDDLEADPSDEAASHEKVRQWARSVSAQAGVADVPDDEDDDDDNDRNFTKENEGALSRKEENDDDEERQSHFARPLRDIRLGESPSRPWGIPVPAKYLEEAESVTSSQPVQVTPGKRTGPTPPRPAADSHPPHPHPGMAMAGGGKCPFAHGMAAKETERENEPEQKKGAESVRDAWSTKEGVTRHDEPRVEANDKTEEVANRASEKKQDEARVVVTGPVFIGYSAEDTIRILRETGLKLG